MLKKIDHPLVQHYLSRLRDRQTSYEEFHHMLGNVALMLFYEATRDLPTSRADVETPLEKTSSMILAGKIHLVGILRAALGMLEGIVAHVSNVDVGHLGMYRDEETLQPVRYYAKLPSMKSGEPTFVIDPMLATGGSIVAALEILKNHGADNLKVITLIAAPEGVERITTRFPHLDIYTAALDRQLNTHGYILPGLGDAGDRQFGT